MNIVAKTASEFEQIKDRVDKGFRFLEVQLTGDFLLPTRNLQDYSIVHSSKEWDVLNIHMPLSKCDDANLEYIGSSAYSSVLLNAGKLAQDCAKFYNHPVTVVIHCGIPLSELKLIPSGLHAIENILYLCLKYYPDVLFSFENLSPCYPKRGKLIMQPTAFDENVEFANYFNEIFKTDRFHTTIDICHILMTQNLLRFLQPESSIPTDMYSLEWYFQKNQNTINNIHLNNMRGLGIQKMHHGASFNEDNEDDIRLLSDILMLYKKYNYNCNLTLEVDELNYFNIQKAPELKQLLEKMLR